MDKYCKLVMNLVERFASDKNISRGLTHDVFIKVRNFN